MTYNEGWIEVLKGGASTPLDSSRNDLARFGKFWAHYIDNCWLKVAVSAAQLVEFLQELDSAREEWVTTLVARVDAADSYIIEAEEY